MKRLTVMLACGVVLCACHSSDDPVTGGGTGTPTPPPPPAPADFAAFARSMLINPASNAPREMDGLEFVMTENPAEFDAEFDAQF